MNVTLPDDFNWKDYISLNSDLSGLNQQNSEKHYLQFGYFERRKYHKKKPPQIIEGPFGNLPSDFNWETYILVNNDLSNMKKDQAVKHYLKYGIKEKREYKTKFTLRVKTNYIKLKKKKGKLPHDFNWKIYLQINNLPFENKIEAEFHYLHVGYKHKRKYTYKGDTYTIGGRIFKEPLTLPNDKKWCKDYNEVVKKYGSTVICFISQGGGKYELMSRVLALSTRFYNPNIDIIVGLPTPFDIYPKISEDTISLLTSLNIKIINITNQVSHDYKIANKYALLEEVSKTSKNHYILFLDTDIICTNPFIPTIGMLTSDLSGITTDYADWVNRVNKSNFKNSFWYQIHKVCEATYEPEKYNPPYLSCITKKPIYADYFNAGYIFIKNKLVIPQTLNELTRKIYSVLSRKSEKKTPRTSDQIAIAVTSSKLNLKTHVVDMEHVSSCIPRHLPNKIIDNQQFCHYHNCKYLRSIFINFDWRQYNLKEKSTYRKDEKLLFNNQIHHQIVNTMINDWNLVFKVKADDLECNNNDFQNLYIYLKEFLLKFKKKISWSDNIETKSIFQVVEYLKNETLNNQHNPFTKYLLEELKITSTDCVSLYDLLTQ